MKKCPESNLLKLYAEGKCTGQMQEEIREHAANCNLCRQQIERFKTFVDVDTASDQHQDEYVTESIPDVSMANNIDGTCDTHPDNVQIAGYDILDRLTPGGQAVVYKAFQKATKRTVAVKVLPPSRHLSEKAKMRFEREVDLAASLRHPNIITIYDSGIAEGQYYYAMEYIDGNPLDKYVQSKKLSNHEIMKLFKKVSGAVAYAHQRGVIHRDLKPGNVIVDADGEPYVLDFGLAKLANNSQQTSPEAMVSVAGQIFGTLAFMSPEQAAGENDSIDVRTDVYSLGVMLYRVLTDKFPYDVSGSLLDTLQNIRQCEPEKLSKTIRINSEIESIVLKSLSKEARHRYQSAAELARDIECWLKGMPISAKADSSLYVLQKLISRNKFASSVVALILVIILSFSYISFDLYLSAQKALKESKTTSEQWSAETTTNFKFLRQRMLINIIRYINDGQTGNAISATRMMANGTKEKLAAVFLLEKRSLSEKETEFRSSVGEENKWFADFIVAEHHLKDGGKAAAMKAFRESYKAMKQMLNDNEDVDTWALARVRARLDILTEQKLETAGSTVRSGVQ